MFYDKYENLCKEIKKTPTGVAIELGIGRATVSYWRNGKTPKQEILNKIANYFGVSVDYLLGRSNDEMQLEREVVNVPKGLTDEQVEEEIKILENSKYVKLARKEERIRNRRRQRLYTLRQFEKKGKQLAADGITMEMLNELEYD